MGYIRCRHYLEESLDESGSTNYSKLLHNARFKASEETHLTQTVQKEISTASFKNIWDRLTLVYGDRVCRIDDYLAVDENATTSSIMTDEEIINAVQNATKNVSDND